MTKRPAAAMVLVSAVLAASAPLSRGQADRYDLNERDGARAWEADTADTGREEAIDEARRLLAEDRPGPARRVLDKWIKENEATDNPYFPEALLLRGDAKVASGNEYEALFDYELMLRDYPQSEHFLTAVRREQDIAERYLDGLKRKVLGIRLVDAEEIAIELLIRVQERAPGSELAERAAITLADHYFDQRDMALARDAYDLYILNHPNGPNRSRAEERLIYAEVARFKGPRYDAAGLLDARVRTRSFASRYPELAERTGINEGLVARIDESLAAQMLEMARWYDTQNETRSVRYVLSRLVREHPRTSAAAKAMEMIDQRGWTLIRPEADRIGEEDLTFEGPGADQVEAVEPDDGSGAEAPAEPGAEPDTPAEDPG